MKKAIRTGILVLLSTALVVVGWLIYQEYNKHAPAKKEWEKLQEEVTVTSEKEDKILSIDWNYLLSINSEVVGWIYVPGCGINYPVLQDDSNSYYLNHTLYGTYDSYGSVFLSAANNPDFTDDNSIIYGHSVQYTGGMFTGLKNYADRSFYDGHPYFYLLTPEGNYRCNIKAFSKTTDHSEYYKTQFSDKETTYQTILDDSLYNSIQLEDLQGPMITLSTCDLDYGLNSSHRLVLMGDKEAYTEKILIED